ncbi:MAG: T9SS type A sorting domain-containing protein [Saprospiraceae bacterium]|nr:T9SS type A sorting domain-containing protein [Saprospiraceae bacterium]
MLRLFSIIATFLFFSMNSVQSQVVVELTIENQSVSGTDFFFDIYARRTATNPGSGDLYLGTADFILTFNSAAFSSPTITRESSSFWNLTSTSGEPVGAIYRISTAVSIVNNEIKINLAQVPFGNQTDFDDGVARVGNQPITHRVGRYKIAGISAPGTADIMWKTSGGGSETRVFSLTNTDPWFSSQVDLIAINPPAAPLPLELVAFTVRLLNDTDVQLDWITASEINTSHFDIQRSIQSNSWITIGTVAAAGNSQTNQFYYLTDEKVFDPNEFTNTNFYYRLKMVDIDGHFEYSVVRQVKFESRNGPMVGDPFPNPTGLGSASVQLHVSIKGETSLRIEIYDSKGNIVGTNSSLLINGMNNVTIGTGSLSLGVYLIKLIMEDGASFVRKLTVQ